MEKVYETAYVDNPHLRDMLANELYDEMTGLGSAESTKPLRLVNMSPNENVYSKSGWDTWVDDYKQLSIQKYFGLNLDQFLNHGRHEATELLRKAKDYIHEESKRSTTVEDEIRKEMGLE